MAALLCACALLAGVVGGTIAPARAEEPTRLGFLVIVNANNPSTAVPRDFLAAAFLKKATRWDDGTAIRPVDLPARSSLRGVFSNRVLQRPVTAVKNYWEQRIFSGNELPPLELDSEDAVVRYVAKYPGAVGYVPVGAKLAGAKSLVVK